MSSFFDDVVEFHRVVCDVPTINRPSPPSADRRRLRHKIMQEEWDELVTAMEAADIVEVADACADLVVTVLGTAAEYGIPFNQVWAEVHRSNMAKAGGPVRDDGKRLKPEGWQPPDVRGVLDPKVRSK